MSDCNCVCACCTWQYVARPNGLYGGNGGTLGQPGAASSAAGGAAGSYVVGASFVTWVVPGTRLGASSG